jgi:hypothetical protein
MNPEVFSAESIKLAVTIIGGLVAGGWAILRMTTNALEKQQEANRKLITEKFIWAESLRQESRASWETHFRKVEDRLDRAFNLMDSMDRRVTTIEICLRRAPCGQILDSDIPVDQCHSTLESLSEVPLKFRRRREDP